MGPMSNQGPGSVPPPGSVQGPGSVPGPGSVTNLNTMGGPSSVSGPGSVPAPSPSRQANAANREEEDALYRLKVSGRCAETLPWRAVRQCHFSFFIVVRESHLTWLFVFS